MWEEGGYITWAATRSSDAAANNIAGFGAGHGIGWLLGVGEFRVHDWGFTD